MTSALAPYVPSRADQQLRAVFAMGEPLVLHPDGPGRKLARGHESPERDRTTTKPVIHAQLIRNLLLSDPVPGRIHQVNISGADIEGELDLRFARTESALVLEHCTFRQPVTFSGAHLQSVSLRHSVIPEIDARHVTVTGELVLDEVEVADRIRLGGAHLTDDLKLSRAIIGTINRVAGGGSGDGARLDLRGSDVKGAVDADHMTVYGLVSTTEATVGGAVHMTNVRILAAAKHTAGAAQDTVAWKGDGMKAGGMVNASGLHANGKVSLVDAQVLGLVMRPAQITNAGHSLVLDRLRSHGSVFIDRGSHLLGGIHAIGMQVGASLYLGSCQVRAPVSGSLYDRQHALNLRRAKISDDLRCEANFRATGTCDLTGSHINGRVALAGASLRPARGTATKAAFVAAGALVGGDLSGDGGFTARGTMMLVNAQVGGGVTIEHAERPCCWDRMSLAAAGLSVARDVHLDVAGTVDLSGAKVTGNLTLHLTRLASPRNRAAADLSDMKAGVLTLRGRPRAGFLDLTRACVTRLLDNPADWPGDSKIVLEGLDYSAIAALDRSGDKEPDRRAWLETGTQWVRAAADRYAKPGFTPQPYHHLAEVYRQAGDDRKARAVLLAMHRRHNKAKIGFRNQLVIRAWNIAQDVFIGYGYAPGRGLSWLIAVALGTAWWFARHGIRPGIIESFILSLGLVLPGSGLDKVEAWEKSGGTHVSHMTVATNHGIAAAVILFGLLFGASVIAALSRVVKR